MTTHRAPLRRRRRSGQVAEQPRPPPPVPPGRLPVGGEHGDGDVPLGGRFVRIDVTDDASVAADPGYTATDLNGHSGPQSVTEGTDAIVRLATEGPGAGSGRFIDRSGLSLI
ncbi:hypothetical protein [Actinomadura violacea]|uniref:Uncharacterized protein n=1 Tax=Actinomadura violacea TaxID=2819934 RepID=A0ABS3RMK8_9ACTN|nr:hypothetical protein [Actinomadura violacea]MBO2457970.1 hypothetical protein [Actinomadura violacea]